MRPAPLPGETFGLIATDSLGRFGEPMANNSELNLRMSCASRGSSKEIQGFRAPSLLTEFGARKPVDAVFRNCDQQTVGDNVRFFDMHFRSANRGNPFGLCHHSQGMVKVCSH